MRIDSIEVYHVVMPLKYPWRTAYGEDDFAESILVRMVSGAQHGWGEATPLRAPTYSSEWAVSMFARYGASDVRPRWAIRIGDARETPGDQMIDGTCSLGLNCRFGRHLLMQRVRPVGPEASSGNDDEVGFVCQAI